MAWGGGACANCGMIDGHTAECRAGIPYDIIRMLPGSTFPERPGMSERQKLLARIAELEAALRPFAEHPGKFAHGMRENNKLGVLENQNTTEYPPCATVGDLRRAAHILEKKMD